MATNNKLIVRNSISLYFRMLLSMLISLYTARIVLETLGISDYGLYNVIGGLITFFTLLKGVISSGVQRYMNYELGTNNIVRLKKIFEASVTIYIIIGVIVFILGETVGLWFLNNKLSVSSDRYFAANIVYQLSIVSAMIAIIQLPYTSVIIAHERMDIYGYVGIGEPILRLILIMLMPILPYDQLITYSFLMLFLSVVVSMLYVTICNRLFSECRFKLSRDKKLCKELLAFTSWNLFETITNELNDQGQNVLLNIFFGPVVNAARAVAMQINNAIRSFAINFLIAVNPQITKNYAQGDMNGYYTLMIRASKFAFIVLAILIIPVYQNVDYILGLWLKCPPPLSGIFTKLILISLLIRVIAEPLFTGILATGKVKKYQIITNCIIIFNIPFCYLFLKQGFNVLIVFYANIAVSFIFVLSRAIFMRQLTGFPIKTYFLMILKNVILLLVSFFLARAINSLLDINLQNFIFSILFSIAISVFLFGLFSLTENERNFLRNLILKKWF